MRRSRSSRLRLRRRPDRGIGASQSRSLEWGTCAATPAGQSEGSRGPGSPGAAAPGWGSDTRGRPEASVDSVGTGAAPADPGEASSGQCGPPVHLTRRLGAAGRLGGAGQHRRRDAARQIDGGGATAAGARLGRRRQHRASPLFGTNASRPKRHVRPDVVSIARPSDGSSAGLAATVLSSRDTLERAFATAGSEASRRDAVRLGSLAAWRYQRRSNGVRPRISRRRTPGRCSSSATRGRQSPSPAGPACASAMARAGRWPWPEPKPSPSAR
jgi:hypothetical protein